MQTPKRLPPGSVEAAIEKAEHYRLLNEPAHAESICLDVLEVDSENQRALITLLLALTDQFTDMQSDALENARALVPRLQSESARHYYSGIVDERWGAAQLQSGAPAESCVAWLRQAMQAYERAQEFAEASNPDPTLRWNTCLRLLQRIGGSQPVEASLVRDLADEFGDDVPPR